MINYSSTLLNTKPVLTVLATLHNTNSINMKITQPFKAQMPFQVAFRFSRKFILLKTSHVPSNYNFLHLLQVIQQCTANAITGRKKKLHIHNLGRDQQNTIVVQSRARDVQFIIISSSSELFNMHKTLCGSIKCKVY